MYNSTVLALHRRPCVVFDPQNDEHRYWYYNFKKTSGWGRCPYTFHCPADYISVPDYIAHLLAEYYMSRDTAARKQPKKTGWLHIPTQHINSPKRRQQKPR